LVLVEREQVRDLARVERLRPDGIEVPGLMNDKHGSLLAFDDREDQNTRRNCYPNGERSPCPEASTTSTMNPCPAPLPSARSRIGWPSLVTGGTPAFSGISQSARCDSTHS